MLSTGKKSPSLKWPIMCWWDVCTHYTLTSKTEHHFTERNCPAVSNNFTETNNQTDVCEMDKVSYDDKMHIQMLQVLRFGYVVKLALVDPRLHEWLTSSNPWGLNLLPRQKCKCFSFGTYELDVTHYSKTTNSVCASLLLNKSVTNSPEYLEMQCLQNKTTHTYMLHIYL